jgi:hypothetical protein
MRIGAWSVERPPVDVASRPYEALLGRRCGHRAFFFRGEPGICTTIKDASTNADRSQHEKVQEQIGWAVSSLANPVSLS